MVNGKERDVPVRKIGNYFFAGNTVYVIHGSVIVNCQLSIVNWIVEDNLSHHHPCSRSIFGQFTRIDARDTRHLFTFQPFTQTFHCIPVAIFIRIVTYDNRFRMYFLTFHKSGESIRFDGKKEELHSFLPEDR